MIIVDEAWTLLDFAAGFFARFGRTVRRYGGSLVVCAQSFKDLQKSEYHKAILKNSAWKILLEQHEGSLSSFQESEEFKDMIPLIRSIGLSPNKYAEALFCSKGIAVIGRLVLDDYSKTLFSTDPLDFNFLRKKTAEGNSLDEAIEESVLQKKSKQNN
jgi:conjugal transfer ATP-binding protein TraC